MGIAAPPGDGRLFVIEQDGLVKVLGADGTLAAQPFLDVTADTLAGGERGLLGLAFAPDYATSGVFFAYLTAKEPEGQIQIRRYRVSATDPNRADPASGTTILRQDHAEHTNHNGGGVRVGPDGKLWATLGDGGGSGDALDSGQDTGTLLGKLLRLELDGSPAAGNPGFPRAEIWQYGLRNVFRFSFDRATGNLLIADVGQDEREEVDLAPAAEGRLPGANWGWPCFEGTRPFRPVCDAPGARAPVHETDHATGVRAIAGGVVVRDPGVPSLAGRYLYGDITWDTLHSVDLGVPGSDRGEAALTMQGAVSIDEDGCGRVVATSISGRVERLVDGPLSPCPAAAPPGSEDPPPVTPVVPGPTGCGLTIAAPRERSRRSLERRGVLVGLSTRTACRVELRLRTAPRAFGPERARDLLPGRSEVRLRLGDAVRRLRRRVVVRVLATAGDRTVTRRAVIRVSRQ